MNEYVGADALHPPAMSRFYRDDVGIVPYKKMHNLPYKSQFISTKAQKKSAMTKMFMKCQYFSC